MKPNENHPQSDDTPDTAGLPHTRPQVFWDRLRHCGGRLFLCGLLLLAFALPLLLAGFFGDLSFASLTDRLTRGEMTEEEYRGAARVMLYAVSLLKTVGYVLFGIGAAGAARQIRQMVWSESYEFRRDFFVGIRQNAGWYSLCFLLVGLFCGFGDCVLQQQSGWLAWLPVFLYAFLIFPVLLHILVQATLYTHRFRDMWYTCTFMYAKTLPVSLLFSFLFLSYRLSDALGFTARYCVKAVWILLLPLCFMAWYLCVSAALDRYINREHYPELVDRGVWRENASGKQ